MSQNANAQFRQRKFRHPSLLSGCQLCKIITIRINKLSVEVNKSVYNYSRYTQLIGLGLGLNADARGCLNRDLTCLYPLKSLSIVSNKQLLPDIIAFSERYLSL